MLFSDIVHELDNMENAPNTPPTSTTKTPEEVDVARDAVIYVLGSLVVTLLTALFTCICK